jgi:hypothetical protein
MRAQKLTTAAAVILSAFLLTTAPTGSGAWAQAGPADIQWAQDTLKSKGYDLGGRVSTKWTEGSKRALSNFQRANGLPATGELDAATMAKLGAARTVSPTMGTLGAPPPGGSAARTTRHEAPPQPKAVPTGRVGSEGGESGVIGGVTLGHAPSTAPGGHAPATAPGGHAPPASAFPAPHSAAVGGAQPHAAPAPRVQSHEEAPSPVAAPRAQVTGGDGKAAGGVLTAADDGFQVANWMRYGVGGVLAATLAAVGFGWWRSGRRKSAFEAAAYDDDDRPARNRVEPSFENVRESKSGLPPLTAPARSRS